MNAKRWAFLSMLLVALLIVALAGCYGPGWSGIGDGARYFYVKPEVTISHLPKLYEPFIITGKATAFKEDLSDTELWIGASGAVYLGGEDRWHGPLKLGEAKTISAIFAFVIEGNHGISSAARPEPPRFERNYGSIPILIHASREASRFGVEINRLGSDTTWQPGEPHYVTAGHTVVLDTASALNQSPSPRIEFIDSPEDLVKLQEEGLLPKELRYRWRNLQNNSVDFSKQFLIAYFDELRPTPGHVLLMKEGQFGRFLWDNGILKADLTTHEVPPGVSRATKPVSSVVIYAFARGDTPGGLPDILAFQGPRTFEFTIDDQPFPTITVDLKTPEGSNDP